jgi:hypothetical protein
VTANGLLLWMSARGHGSWSQFRAAVEELHIAETEDVTPASEEEEGSASQRSLPLYQTLRLNLQRLGHAEFFAGANGADWRVTPPSLSVIQRGSNWLAVVTGARSDALLRRLHNTARNLVAMETTPLEACPDQIRLIGVEAPALSAVADQAGMLLQGNAPLAILTSLPPVDHAAVRKPHELPFGTDWRIERFSTSTLSWRVSTREAALAAAAGLFRFSLAYRSHVLLCLRGATYQIPAQVGKYYLLSYRRKNVISYDASSQSFSIPASCRPPFLVERALILCSGLLPSYEPRPSAMGMLTYSEIPEPVARLALELLRQRTL